MTRRSLVLAMLAAVSVLTFLDRMAIAIAEPSVRQDLHLSPVAWGWVLSSYILANALFELPSGALGDRWGQRQELARISIWWSIFTALTGWCRSLGQLVAARFLFGLGAAGAYPNASGVIARWFPPQQHARAQGVVWGASRLGGALAPLLLIPLFGKLGWRSAFWLLGAAGVVWGLVWLVWFRNLPSQMHGVSAQELAELEPTQMEPAAPVPWRRLARHTQLQRIALAYFCYAWGSWFYFGWFTTWLVQGAGFSRSSLRIVAALPFVLGLASNLVGGQLAQRLVMREGPRTGYRLLCSVCLAATALMLFGLAAVRQSWAVVVLAALGLGVMDLMLPAAWAMCLRIGGSYGGAATGVMNTFGNLGGWVGAIVFGYVVKLSGSYRIPLLVIAGMVLAASLLFWRVDCSQPIEAAPPQR
ncbi:MAG: MFS transporter [Acidobacteriota bacterium]|nr:MFS transporter [Acidobacteriota bacterium]